MSGPYFFSMTPNRAVRCYKVDFSSPLPAAQPLTVLSCAWRGGGKGAIHFPAKGATTFWHQGNVGGRFRPLIKYLAFHP